jgi:uncharacterized protein YqiB (DUF1249 family)
MFRVSNCNRRDILVGNVCSGKVYRRFKEISSESEKKPTKKQEKSKLHIETSLDLHGIVFQM